MEGLLSWSDWVVASDLLDDLHKFFWSGDLNEDAGLSLAEFRKVIAVEHIDTDEPHVQALVASLFKVFKFQSRCGMQFSADESFLS